MRVSFNPGSLKSFSSFFRYDVDFLDIYVTKDVVFIISNRQDVYAHKAFSVITREDVSGLVSFRVDKKEFLDLMCEGVVVLFVTESQVEITFKPNNGFSYTMIRPYQASDVSGILQKHEILAQRNKFSRINLLSLEKHIRLIKGFSSSLYVRNNKLVCEDTNINLYVNISCENLSLDTQTAQYLLSNCDTFFGFQNYIIGEGEDSVVIARQLRGDPFGDDEIFLSKKATHRVRADLTPVCVLSRKASSSSVVYLNLDSGICSIEEMSDSGTPYRMKFVTRFEVKEFISAQEVKQVSGLESFSIGDMGPVVVSARRIPELQFPLKLFKDQLSTINCRDVTVLLKKKFVQFNIGSDIVFVVRRSERSVTV